MSDVRTIRVFSASPGDLAVERASFQQVLEELNAGFGDALDITFEPLGWEDTLASTGRRSQEVINRDSICSRNREISVVCHAISEVSRLRLQVGDRPLRRVHSGDASPVGAGGSGRSAVLVVHGRRVSPRVGRRSGL